MSTDILFEIEITGTVFHVTKVNPDLSIEYFSTDQATARSKEHLVNEAFIAIIKQDKTKETRWNMITRMVTKMKYLMKTKH